jgi:hypothetical protein
MNSLELKRKSHVNYFFITQYSFFVVDTKEVHMVPVSDSHKGQRLFRHNCLLPKDRLEKSTHVSPPKQIEVDLLVT